MVDKAGLRLPNTNLNQAKLKVILQQLKKADREKDVNSARYNWFSYVGMILYSKYKVNNH